MAAAFPLSSWLEATLPWSITTPSYPYHLWISGLSWYRFGCNSYCLSQLSLLEHRWRWWQNLVNVSQTTPIANHPITNHSSLSPTVVQMKDTGLFSTYFQLAECGWGLQFGTVSLNIHIMSDGWYHIILLTSYSFTTHDVPHIIHSSIHKRTKVDQSGSWRSSGWGCWSI